MQLEMIFHKGEDRRPLAVFIHGMGMNMKAWSNPSEAKILGGKYPLRVLLYGGNELVTSFEDLRGLGFSLLSWTQSRPVGPMHIAVAELEGLIGQHSSYTGNGIIFICHSRGGLIARKYLENHQRTARGLITLATPHHGTSMARWPAYVSPLTSLLYQLVKGFSKNEIDSVFQRILGFLSSSGLRELLPESKFYAELKDIKQEGVLYISIGGTNPDLLRPILPSIPDLLSKVVPERIIPGEMREGFGDGLVTSASSRLSYADEHRDFPVNHASILFDRSVRDFIAESVESL
ncbi:MAG: alpha/beta fold hydrolase [Thermodesulfovibrionales bacterium]